VQRIAKGREGLIVRVHPVLRRKLGVTQIHMCAQMTKPVTTWLAKLGVTKHVKAIRLPHGPALVVGPAAVEGKTAGPVEAKIVGLAGVEAEAAGPVEVVGCPTVLVTVVGQVRLALLEAVVGQVEIVARAMAMAVVGLAEVVMCPALLAPVVGSNQSLAMVAHPAVLVAVVGPVHPALLEAVVGQVAMPVVGQVEVIRCPALLAAVVGSTLVAILGPVRPALLEVMVG
jgi:hypothetical protein